MDEYIRIEIQRAKGHYGINIPILHITPEWAKLNLVLLERGFNDKYYRNPEYEVHLLILKHPLTDEERRNKMNQRISLFVAVYDKGTWIGDKWY